MRSISSACVLVVAAVTLTFVASCSDEPVGDDPDGGGRGVSRACTIRDEGELVYCYAFDEGYPEEATRTFCELSAGSLVWEPVSSCPAEGVVGTCAVTATSGDATHQYDWLFYGSNRTTCEAAEQICEEADTYTDGVVSGSFEGDGCGSGAGAYAGLDEELVATAPADEDDGICVISSGEVSVTIPCTVLPAFSETADGPQGLFDIKSTEFGEDAFNFQLPSVLMSEGTFESDGTYPAVASVRDVASHEWNMFDNFTGMPDMGSYALDITEATEQEVTQGGILVTVWRVHGSLEVELEPQTLGGATGTVSVQASF